MSLEGLVGSSGVSTDLLSGGAFFFRGGIRWNNEVTTIQSKFVEDGKSGLYKPTSETGNSVLPKLPIVTVF